MSPLSVIIITYNEAHRIRDCILSVQPVADEIVVVDSFSTDETAAICRELGAEVILNPFAGMIEQKNFALSRAVFPMVLSLDADERLDSRLQASILKEKSAGFPCAAYSMNRLNNYCGHWIRHGDYYPDRKTRLFHKEQAHFGGINPHDWLELPDEAPICHLKGDILHYSFASRKEHEEKMDRFSTAYARSLYQRGRKVPVTKPWISAAWSFIKGYIWKLGFLDGSDGLYIARRNARYTLDKYQKLRKMYQTEAAAQKEAHG
jgi:glycosyltransferase involved in cell wall biosynthesis